jgi:hypothetical protein
MSDKSHEPCHCTGSGYGGQARGSEQRLAVDNLAKAVIAKVPQEVAANFTVRLVPGRTLDGIDLRQVACRPRGNRTGWTPSHVAIDPGLLGVLSKADKAMVAWLARDSANAKRFLAEPVAALRESGVTLSRAEEKALARAHAEAGSDRVVGPGVKVASLDVKAYPNGFIGRLGPSRRDGTNDKPADSFGCEPRRKG